MEDEERIRPGMFGLEVHDIEEETVPMELMELRGHRWDCWT